MKAKQIFINGNTLGCDNNKICFVIPREVDIALLIRLPFMLVVIELISFI